MARLVLIYNPDAIIHAAGCRDIKRDLERQVNYGGASTPIDFEGSSVRDCVLQAWGPDTAGSFFEDAGYTLEEGVEQYADYTLIKPCAMAAFGS